MRDARVENTDGQWSTTLSFASHRPFKNVGRELDEYAMNDFDVVSTVGDETTLSRVTHDFHCDDGEKVNRRQEFSLMVKLAAPIVSGLLTHQVVGGHVSCKHCND